MNKGACDCCIDPFFAVDPDFRCEPFFEQRFRDMSRNKCGILLDGVYYKETTQEFECSYLEDDDDIVIVYTTTQTQTNTEGSNYFNPEETFLSDCDFESTFDPPFGSWPNPCKISGAMQPVGSPTGTDVYSDEELKNNILSILQGASYFPSNTEFDQNQPAQGWYIANNFQGFATETEYRISHRPIPSCYLKVWIAVMTYEWDESFEFGALLNDTNEIYTWQPDSNPCLPDPTRSVRDDAQIIKSPIYSIGPSQTNVGTFAFIRKYSFLPNYEPDDPIIVNPFTVSRPDPDCRPNGVPNPNSGC
jgi:hypothetical protein